METIMRGLSAGFVVGVICVIYVVFRISKVHEQLEAEGVDLYKDEKEHFVDDYGHFQQRLNSLGICRCRHLPNGAKSFLFCLFLDLHRFYSFSHYLL